MEQVVDSGEVIIILGCITTRVTDQKQFVDVFLVEP